MNYAETLSNGAKRLAAIPGALKDIAEKCNVPTSTLSRLRTGALQYPSDAVGAKIELHLGITRDEWHQREEIVGFKPTEVPEEPPKPEPPSTPQGHLQVCREWRIALQKKGASAKDITAALEAERRAVELVRKALNEGAAAIIDAIILALEPFPEAREAVARVLEASV